MSAATRALAAAAIVVAGLGCVHADGRFRAEGPKLGAWTLLPDTCTSTERHGVQGVDLFRNDEREDTELVIASGFILARVPGEDRMIAFARDDCRLLDVDLVWHTARRNGVQVRSALVKGSVQLQCERPLVGKIEGSATFSCL